MGTDGFLDIAVLLESLAQGGISCVPCQAAVGVSPYRWRWGSWVSEVR